MQLLYHIYMSSTGRAVGKLVTLCIAIGSSFLKSSIYMYNRDSIYQLAWRSHFPRERLEEERKDGYTGVDFTSCQVPA